ncbi:N-acetylmuramoyl-L-alanine amidase [Paenibacillus turpanensis]|uniref:N-acetylmuramoyl-L-alanine amidase n=1 Tax=Paenibacillus turpanensis TaxID=2689078 RepID=UPI00140DBCD1|nr:N-acetylmuramoyl-L-alanine amidase [Paenibacillus turpanensis]
MRYHGVVVHHSACPNINGKGYDYYVTKDGGIIPGSVETDPDFIHICIEGDFQEAALPLDDALRNQLFVACKLIVRLSQTYGFSAQELYPHALECPGRYFPWSELVISISPDPHQKH